MPLLPLPLPRRSPHIPKKRRRQMMARPHTASRAQVRLCAGRGTTAHPQAPERSQRNTASGGTIRAPGISCMLNLVILVSLSSISPRAHSTHCFLVFFVAIVVFAIIEVCAHMRIRPYNNPVLQLSISEWLTARYNSCHDFLSTSLRDRV